MFLSARTKHPLGSHTHTLTSHWYPIACLRTLKFEKLKPTK